MIVRGAVAPVGPAEFGHVLGLLIDRLIDAALEDLGHGPARGVAVGLAHTTPSAA